MVIEGGPTGLPPEGNPVGHTAIAVSGAGLYSFGNNVDLGSSVAAYLLVQAQTRNTTMYIIRTTPAQDAAALTYLSSFRTWRMPDGLINALVKDNCSTRSNEALSAAGLAPYIQFPLEGPIFLPQNIPGSAGVRALFAGAKVYRMPQGSVSVPQIVAGFEPGW
jgi:hypothetical protein